MGVMVHRIQNARLRSQRSDERRCFSGKRAMLMYPRRGKLGVLGRAARRGKALNHLELALGIEPRTCTLREASGGTRRAKARSPGRPGDRAFALEFLLNAHCKKTIFRFSTYPGAVIR
jgi:hypothetical protein